MTEYTTLYHKQIESLLECYNLDELISAKLLSGGSENTNYKLNTSVGDFVLTICEQKTKHETILLADLLVHLQNHQFDTSKVIETRNGEYVVLLGEKPAMIKNFLHGTIVKDLPDATLISLGQQLAKLHAIDTPDYLSKTVTFGKESFDDIEAYAAGSSFHKWLTTIRDSVLHHCDNDLPKTLIHSDLFFDNVIISSDGSTATIMDFEEACHYYRVFDIGMMLVGLCEESDQLNKYKAKLVLRGYQQVAVLEAAEKQALQVFTAYAAAATAFWRHKQYFHVMPDIKLQDRYLHMKNFADSVLDIPVAQFSELLNRSET